MKNLPFFVGAALHLLGLAVEHNALIFTTKPLLMPLLGVWFATQTAQFRGGIFFRRALLGALAFSTFGDVLLMFSGEMYFLSGLASFLLAHLFYIRAFTSVCSFKNGFLKESPWWALPFLAFPILLLYLLWDGIPAGMKLPVTAYACVISLMALSAVNLKGKVPSAIFWTLLAGVVLFLISDSLIAIGKFGAPFGGARLAIMATYIGGQYLLVKGALGIFIPR